jgi:hypothetical protein
MGPITATLTITAEDAAELGRLFAAIGAAIGEAVSETAPRPAEPDSSHKNSGAWTPEVAGLVLRSVQPKAHQALAFVALHGPVVPMDDLASELGRKGSKLAGSLASIGAAVRRLKAPGPPFVADYQRRTYTMSDVALEAFRVALEREESAR